MKKDIYQQVKFKGCCFNEITKEFQNRVSSQPILKEESSTLSGMTMQHEYELETVMLFTALSVIYIGVIASTDVLLSKTYYGHVRQRSPDFFLSFFLSLSPICFVLSLDDVAKAIDVVVLV